MALLICIRLGVCGPSAATAPLAPCAEIEPGPLEMRRPIKIWRGLASVSGWFLAGHGQAQDLRHAPTTETFLARDAAKAAGLVMLAGNGSAYHHAIETEIPGERFRRDTRNALAHQRTPRDGR